LLALDSKLPGGHCLTHIGREGEAGDLAVLRKEEWNLLVELVRSDQLTSI
jgi:hypothetical protein